MRRTAPLRLEMRSRNASTSRFRSSLEFNGSFPPEETGCPARSRVGRVAPASAGNRPATGEYRAHGTRKNHLYATVICT